MKRPEKKEDSLRLKDFDRYYNKGFNRACDAYEKFLPSEEELVDCISNLESNIRYMKLTKRQKRFIAKAIYNRIHKGKG